MSLTNQELFMLLLSIACVVMAAGFIFRSFIKIAASIAICCLIFGVGFGWLPEQIEKIKNGETTINEVINGVVDDIPMDEIKNKIEEGGDYIEANKESWIESLKTAWEKILGIYEEPGIEEVPNNP